MTAGRKRCSLHLEVSFLGGQSFLFPPPFFCYGIRTSVQLVLPPSPLLLPMKLFLIHDALDCLWTCMPLPARTLQEREDREWTAVKKAETPVLDLGKDSAPAVGVP